MHIYPLGRLIISLIIFCVLIIGLVDWITIEMRGIINRWRMKGVIKMTLEEKVLIICLMISFNVVFESIVNSSSPITKIFICVTP